MTVDTQQLHEAFLDLTLADDELVRAEFDALIAACWESPSEPPLDKPCPPRGGQPAQPQPRRVRRRIRAPEWVLPQRPDGRARSPPRRQAAARRITSPSPTEHNSYRYRREYEPVARQPAAAWGGRR